MKVLFYKLFCTGRFLIQAEYQDNTQITTEKLLIQSDKLFILGEISSCIVKDPLKKRV